jgi:hypothetical protein
MNNVIENKYINIENKMETAPKKLGWWKSQKWKQTSQTNPI